MTSNTSDIIVYFPRSMSTPDSPSTVPQMIRIALGVPFSLYSPGKSRDTTQTSFLPVGCRAYVPFFLSPTALGFSSLYTEATEVTMSPFPSLLHSVSTQKCLLPSEFY